MIQKIYGLIVIGICALLISSMSVLAASKSIDVRSGKKTRIDSLGVYGEGNCYPEPPPKAVFKQPEHGTISTAVHNGVISDGVCKGKRIKYLYVYYQSNRGYRGKDKVNIKLIYSYYADSSYIGQQQSKSTRFTINVK